MCRTKIICNDGSPIYPSICNANSFFTWILRLVLFCKQPQRCNKAKIKKIKRIDSHTKRSIIINMYIPVYEIGIRDEYDKCAHTHTHTFGTATPNSRRSTIIGQQQRFGWFINTSLLNEFFFSVYAITLVRARAHTEPTELNGELHAI